MTRPLVIGKRYLCGLPPWSVATVVYLGPIRIPGWQGYSRVRNLITGKVIWVKTEAIRTLLVAMHGGANEEERER